MTNRLLLHEKEKKEQQKVHVTLLNQQGLEKEQVVMKRRLESLEAAYAKKKQEITNAAQQLENEEKAYKDFLLRPDLQSILIPPPLEFGNRKKALEDNLISLQQHYQQDIQPLKDALTRYLEYQTRTQEELKSGQHAMLLQIETKYDFLFAGLSSKAKEIEQILSSKVVKIKIDTEKLLQENAHKTSSHFAKLTQDLSAFAAEMDKHVKKLSAWQNEYKRW